MNSLTTDHRWTLEMSYRLKSQNKFKHWRVRHEETKRLEADLRYMLFSQGQRKASASATQQRLTITRNLGIRERLWDDGNGTGGSVKQLVDALKRLGWFTDDSPRYLELVFNQDSTRRDRPGTTITLERLRTNNQPGNTPDL